LPFAPFAIANIHGHFNIRGDTDTFQGHAVDPGAPLVGMDTGLGVTEDVRPIDFVVQGVETAGWFLLGLAVELPLKCPDGFRGG
jgi:hypothetical protein